MSVLSTDHYAIMEMFERIYEGRRLDREPKSRWPRGYIYQDGNINNLFIAYRRGVAYGRVCNNS